MIDKPKGKNDSVKYVRLYLDDIEDIMQLLKENCAKVVVSGDGFELEKPFEIDEYKELTQEQLNSLHIHTENPVIHIFVSHTFIMRGVIVSIVDDNPKNLGLMEKVLDILRPRHRKLVAFYQSFKTFLLITAIITVAVLFSILKFNLSSILVLIVFLSWMIFRWISCELPSMRYQLLLEKEHSYTIDSFFKRNKDQIILLALGALIGSAVTLLVAFIKANWQ